MTLTESIAELEKKVDDHHATVQVRFDQLTSMIDTCMKELSTIINSTSSNHPYNNNRSPEKMNFHKLSEPFNYRVIILDPNNVEENWKILEHAIRRIYNDDSCDLNFQQLYRHAYGMVLNDYGGDKLYFGLVATMTSHLKEMAICIEGTQGDSFLEELISKWNHHHKSLQTIKDIVMCMDRTYAPNSQKTHVYELGLNPWTENVIYSEQIMIRLSNTLLDFVCRERAGQVVNRELIRNTTKMLMDLGSSVYEQVFETPFLQVSAEFYKAESQKLIDSCDCDNYSKKVESFVFDEVDRVCQYLDPKGGDKITYVVYKEMIANHRLRLIHMDNSGVINMFLDDKYEDEDLSGKDKLFSLVTDGLNKIYDVLISFTHQKVLCAGNNRLERSDDPSEFSQRLLD